MKFLCLDCDAAMGFAERQLPGDGTMAAVFTCPGCGREVAMLTNPMETRFVASMGVEIGGRTVPLQPFEQTRTGLDRAREDAFEEPAAAPESATGSAPPAGAAARPAAPRRGGVSWSDDARARLERVPRFVRGMVKRIYTEYAQEQNIGTITVEVMDRARSDLGLEGM